MMTPKLKKSLPMNAMARRQGIVLTDDDQLRTFARHPDQKIRRAYKDLPSDEVCFRDILENAERQHAEILTFFHDHFFGGGERTLHLTHPEFVECTEKLAEAAEAHGIGIGASVTNPLDLGRNFKEVKGVGGQHRFFAEGALEADGRFRFVGPLSGKWCNNKGNIYPHFDRARLFAMTAENDGSPYMVIPEASIREIPAADYTCTISAEPYEWSTYFGDRHMIVEGQTDCPGNRVFAVFYMDTPEMDYFHPEVTEFVHGVIDLYREKGIEFMELYSDEMHIQFDWDFTHFGPFEIPTRYMTENFQAELAKEDPIFADFDKALIYMGYNMFVDRERLGREGLQNVMGRSDEAIFRTFRMRRTYFEMLQDQVVGLCCDARDYIRKTYVKHKGWDPLCLGHATWQESPTCDQYGPGRLEGMHHRAAINGYCAYDYSPDYVYSSTIREAISGCYDYFKWNDYFSYGGSDFCECGWFDRNYYGGAMSASLGALNRNEAPSWGAWGFPNEARKRFDGVRLGYGAYGRRENIVTWGRPRTVDVLYIYPKDLTAVEERFGSWMVQYGYANYVPRDRFVRLGQVKDGQVQVGLGVYSTVVVGLEPFYDEAFLKMLEAFARGGGRVVWNSTPPADQAGRVPDRWLSFFGLDGADGLLAGTSAHCVEFLGRLEGIAPMKVPTDFLPDRIYTVRPGTAVPVAAANQRVIGTWQAVGRGQALYIGCRLRDDQSGESGDAPSTLFDVLKAIGAYGGAEALDNTETISRKTEHFVTKFANGAVSVCNHYRSMKELWDGGFQRDPEADARALDGYPYMVDLHLSLTDQAIEGHCVSCEAEGWLQYRLDSEGRLCGFSSNHAESFRLDGRDYRFTEEPVPVTFGALEPCRVPDGYAGGWIVASDAADVDIGQRIPADAEIYRDDAMDGTDLAPDGRLSFDGSRVHLGEVRMAVILFR